MARCPRTSERRRTSRDDARRLALRRASSWAASSCRRACATAQRGPVGLLSPWTAVIVTAAVFAFFASARSLQIGDGVAVIAVTSVAANLSAIVAGLAVFGDQLGKDAFVIGVRVAAFALILVGAALIPAPVRAGDAMEESDADGETPAASSALSGASEAE